MLTAAVGNDLLRAMGVESGGMLMVEGKVAVVIGAAGALGSEVVAGRSALLGLRCRRWRSLAGC